MTDRAGPFDWSGGHAALDFVNTLDERPLEQPIENLATYRDLVRFSELAGFLKPSLAAALRTLTGPGCSPGRDARSRAARTCPRCPGSRAQAAARAAKRFGCHCRRCPGSARSPSAGSVQIARKSCDVPLVPSSGCVNAAARVRACCRRPPDGRRPPTHQEVRSVRLRRLFCRHQQGPPQAVVQHEKLRQSRKTATLALQHPVARLKRRQSPPAASAARSATPAPAAAGSTG